MPYIVSVTLTIDADSEDGAWKEYQERIENREYSKDSISIDYEEE